MAQKRQGSFLDQWLKKKPSVIESTTDSDALQSSVITDNIGEAVSVSATDIQDAHCDESTSISTIAEAAL